MPVCKSCGRSPEAHKHSTKANHSWIRVMCQPERSRCLCLDSDIVFVGKTLDALEQYDEDFIVAATDFSPEAVEEQFFSLADMWW